ncbi:DUF2179 domain-containing protein [candidate division KSB1 bacterium]|nr:DUF2179 domain-containing protein [candidate division KSB1 bacterium]
MDLHVIATSGFLLPILIFAARVIDVSIGTIRIIFISRNMKYLAALFGFFEILIWLYAIVKRKSISSFINVVKKYNPKAFYTIENVGVVAESDIPQLRQETRLFNFLISKKN